jgi:hypothetical protein
MRIDLRRCLIIAMLCAMTLGHAGCAAAHKQSPQGGLRLPSPWATVRASLERPVANGDATAGSGPQASSLRP